MNFCVVILILKMEKNNSLAHHFKKCKNATEMQKKICTVYGEDAVTDPKCQKWFGKFCAQDFLLDCAPQVDQLKLIAIKSRH